ncbi:hypothetical protein TRP66_02830 [Pseudomonas sp. JDS28PS106]|uniref:hypothetical protein n=1 Tax=Pseudomonas sp. JDS28PS106 TaxID=2497235 RepID=UPI002FD10322
MPSYGFAAINDSGVVSIDSEYARLSVLVSGRYSGSGQSVTVTFPAPIATQEPPLIFVRPDNNNATVVIGCSLGGTPGNWTSFTVIGQTGYSPAGKYFIGGFMASPKAHYGFRLWDGSGTLIFDSGTTSAVFSRFFQNWTYVMSTQGAQGFYTNWYSSPFNPSTDEYLMINNATMRMLAGDNVGRTCGITFDFARSELWFTTSALSNPIAFMLPAVFAKIVA